MGRGGRGLGNPVEKKNPVRRVPKKKTPNVPDVPHAHAVLLDCTGFRLGTIKLQLGSKLIEASGNPVQLDIKPGSKPVKLGDTSMKASPIRFNSIKTQ